MSHDNYNAGKKRLKFLLNRNKNNTDRTMDYKTTMRFLRINFVWKH